MDFENAEALGIDPARIGVIGDSAGGNLAAAVTLRARDEGAPRIAFQALIYPAVEHGWDTGSAHENAEGYLLQRESMHWFWNHYVPDKSLADDWRVSPLKASDHAGLPPAFIATAEFDPLRDDGRAYHAALHDAGVPVTYVEYDGMIHGFYWMQGVVDGTKRLHADLAEAIREGLAGEGQRLTVNGIESDVRRDLVARAAGGRSAGTCRASAASRRPCSPSGSGCGPASPRRAGRGRRP